MANEPLGPLTEREQQTFEAITGRMLLADGITWALLRARKLATQKPVALIVSIQRVDNEILVCPVAELIESKNAIDDYDLEADFIQSQPKEG